MQIGSAITTPEGYKQLRQDTAYYLLCSDAAFDRVLLVFWPRKDDPVLLSMPQYHFEQGLEQGLINAAEPDKRCPAWLLLSDGRTVEEASSSWSPAAVASHQARIRRRLALIEPITTRLDQVLRSKNPKRIINKAAAECIPQQNRKRFRSWVLTWAIFGEAGLHYATPAIGRWDRCKEGRQKVGKKPIHDPHGGHVLVDQVSISNMLLGYDRYAGPGVSMPTIYRQTLRKIFGCLETKDGKNVTRFYHPDGNPFPTLDQFRYRLRRTVGQEEIRIKKEGAQRVRNKYAPSRGAFSEAVSNLHECVEADGYWIKELPRAYIESSPLPAVVTVRLRDVGSGILLGTGFSVAGESAQAYRLACFCAAIPKSEFGRLIGMPIRDEDWPSQGLPLNLTTDRGAGAPTSKSEIADRALGGQEMTPSYAPQSKATIETSNPHHIKFSGPPTHVASEHTPVDLIRQEVARTLAQNHSSDVSARLTPDMIRAGVIGTPISIYQYLDSLGRNDARRINFGEAIRRFLPRVNFEIRRERDGAYFHQQRFDSDALRATGILERASAGTLLPGFHFTVLRYAWVEIGGRLIEVTATLPLRDDAEQLYVSVEELAQIDELRRSTGSRLRSHSQAAKSHFERAFEESTGKAMDAGMRRRGKPRRTIEGLREASEIKAHITPRSRRGS